MSENDKEWGDKAKGGFGDAGSSANEGTGATGATGGTTGGTTGGAAGGAAGETHKPGGEFKDEARKTANEFSEGLKGAGGENKKIMAGVLAIVLGAFGIHKFILGYQKEGIILLVVSVIGIVLSCVGIGIFMIWISGLVGLVEGIIYLTKSDEDFYNTYQVGKKPWF